MRFSKINKTLLTFAAFAGVLATSIARADEAELPAKVPSGVKLVIADEANNVKTLMKLSGEQDKLAANVAYANFTSGPLRQEAIKAGAAQVGAVGDVPPILAQYANTGFKIVGAIKASGTSSRITTAPGTDINSLADLKGKKLGVNEGTASQAALLRNLRGAGLTVADIKPIKLGLAELADALRARQIDAAMLKQPDRERYLATSASAGAKALENAPGANSGLSYLYASPEALKDPAVAAAIRDFVIHWYRALIWTNANKDRVIKDYLVADQKLSLADATTVVEGQGTLSVPGFTEQTIATQQETIDLLQSANSFTGKTLVARDEFDLRFAGLSDKSNAATD
jgi:sulfonate transport system substrate-binding protein